MAPPALPAPTPNSSPTSRSGGSNDMTKQRKGLWNRTTHVLGKWIAGVVSLADDRRPNAARAVWTDYPRFPPF
jgi:hypothetical protein